jgi:hypothetical protein
MPTISIVAFRGLSFSKESALIRTGHVALGGVISDKLIGFSPTPQAIEAAGGEMELFKLLRAGKAQPGCLQDDTTVFLRAKELSTLNKNIEIWELDVEISIEILTTIKAWYNEKREALYNFPDNKGRFEAGQYNCAIFPVVLGVPIPISNGQLYPYVEAMVKNGAFRW